MFVLLTYLLTSVNLDSGTRQGACAWGCFQLVGFAIFSVCQGCVVEFVCRKKLMPVEVLFRMAHPLSCIGCRHQRQTIVVEIPGVGGFGDFKHF